MTQTSTVLLRGFQELSQEGLRAMQEQLQRNIDGFTTLLRCRSVQDVVAAQNELARNSLELAVEVTRRLAEVSSRIANEASQTLADRGGRRRAAKAPYAA